MMYEAEKKEVFVSKEYLERLNNPTSWTKEILSNYISPSRTICSVIASKSIGLASFISTIRFVNKEVENAHNVEQLKLSINDITLLQGITGMHVLLGDNTFGQMNTEEKKFRSSQGKNDVIISQALILEGLNFFSLQKAISYLKKNFLIKENKNIIINFYSCQHVFSKVDL